MDASSPTDANFYVPVAQLLERDPAKVEVGCESHPRDANFCIKNAKFCYTKQACCCNDHSVSVRDMTVLHTVIVEVHGPKSLESHKAEEMKRILDRLDWSQILKEHLASFPEVVVVPIPRQPDQRITGPKRVIGG